ncbi:hypothetical protein JVT61DRAFT_12586 [Boletus reticuloceps]|uniref:Helicase C-terminal domain-containing protein n=1 Tax=Boletus reticuloceps TaxID=495285 RepID=A0A8I2YDM1_9AGAM|nr:hypothetical protein JVT61DRAFT_13431 [Boletus reticuloceps]KAG6369956.1 hypothetical protein JVT61DRAFT_12586 [Boletus reticuloceps]
MACTSAFAQGVDRPNVKFVVVFQPSYGILLHMQEVGRAGRNGAEAHAFFLVSDVPPLLPKGPTSSGPDLQREMADLVFGEDCKVYTSMRVLDGPELAYRCRERPGRIPCDVCQKDSQIHQMALKAVENPLRPYCRLYARPTTDLQSNTGCTDRTMQENPAVPAPAVAGQPKRAMAEVPPMPISRVIPKGTSVDRERTVSLANEI